MPGSPIRMSMNPLPPRRPRPADVLQRRLRPADAARRHARLERTRVSFGDGARTTLHVASYDAQVFNARVVALDPPRALVRWCREQGVRNAIVGGFYVRPAYAPLGQLRIGGVAQPSVAFDAPWGDTRACVQIVDGSVQIARRDRLGDEPKGDLLQAGPLLLSEGRRIHVDGEDAEGFSAGAHQFDSDITIGRYPRAAFGIAGERLVAVVCDGRTRRDAGMTLAELGDALLALGVTEALNLDGGGSASLVHGGRLRNRPREEHGVDLLDGRAIATAIVFETP
jgi:phosphodiester glycosidase